MQKGIAVFVEIGRLHIGCSTQQGGRVNRRVAIPLVFTVIAILLAGCRGVDTTPVTRLDGDAQALSSRAATDVINGNVDDLYSVTHPNTKKLMSKSDLATLLAQFEGFSGKPLEAQLKRRAHGATLGGTWGQRPMWKFWYALRTSKAEPGTYYLTVEIVADGDVLRVARVADVVISGDKP
jgi:hypothetical protein